jgi:hypothetical protein
MKVLAGLDGWLFLTNDSNRVIDQITGRLRLSEEQKASWINCLRSRADTFGRLNMPFITLLVRNKESVYRKYLPPEVVYDDVMFREFTALLSDVNQVGRFIVSPLNVDACDKRLYSRIDTHWTAFGAAVAFKQILAELGALGLSLPSTYVSRPPERILKSGDLGSKVVPPREDVDWHLSPSFESYTVFYNGIENNGAIRVLQNDLAPIDMRACIFGNSFSETELLTIFADNFREVFFLFSPNVDLHLVDRIRPDFVVVQMLERFIPRVPGDANGLSLADFAAMKIVEGRCRPRYGVGVDSISKELGCIPSDDVEGAIEHLGDLFVRRIPNFSEVDRREALRFLAANQPVKAHIYPLMDPSSDLEVG